MDITDVKVQKDLQLAKHIDTYKHRNAMYARVFFWGMGGLIETLLVMSTFLREERVLTLKRTKNVELTHTQVFCGRLCVLCE